MKIVALEEHCSTPAYRAEGNRQPRDTLGHRGKLLGYDAASQTFTADPDDVGPAAPFTFRNPDFNFKSLRGNAVLRWEYRPGSTLYLVWTQSRSDFENTGEFKFNDSMSRLFEAKPDNILMLKFTYWWSI